MKEMGEKSTKWNKIKIKQHKRSCWLVVSQLASCVQVISDCRLRSDEPKSDCGSTARCWTSELIYRERQGEETTHLSASSLNTSQANLSPEDYFSKSQAGLYCFLKLPVRKKKSCKWKDTPSPVWVCCRAGRLWPPGSSCPPALWAWTWWWDDPSSTFSHNLPLGKATERISEIIYM